MALFNRKKEPEAHAGEISPSEKATPAQTPADRTPANNSQSSLPIQAEHNSHVAPEEALKKQPVTPFAVILGAIASIGGFMFGYESGQISGFLQMSDFLDRFGENGLFSAIRQGTIVALLCAGTLVGCLGSGWMCDKIGRRYSISASAFFYIIGVIIEITSSTVWVQFAMGRFTAGLGIGALSTSVPMYQSESVPKNIRGAIVSSYQLLITLGIWTAYMVNWGTEANYDNSAQWRIPNGLSALWAIILGTAILFLPESPRYAYRQGKVEEARKTLAHLNGLQEYSPLIDAEIAEIEEKLKAERVGGDHHWYEIFTGPRMLYRTVLGMVLQAGQQLTGANFFFYYSTTIFKSTGLSNSYVTSIILGSVNVLATILGLWLVQNCGRRKCLIWGALVMFGCFMIYSLVGTYSLPNTPESSGKVLIVFTCIFIAAFATTWGPLVWAIVGELYPARYRAPCMALATASNWLFNFLISFFTTLITDRIHYWYGMVFGGSCLALAAIVYLFVIESKDRTLEEIDTMYTMRVNPIKSANWDPRDLGSEGTNGMTTDELYLAGGGKEIKKGESAGAGLMVHDEVKFPANPQQAPETRENQL